MFQFFLGSSCFLYPLPTCMTPASEVPPRFLWKILQERRCWNPIVYVSRLLTEFETKQSITDWELLTAVWSIEHFKLYLLRTEFEVGSDHKAVKSMVKVNKSNRTISSRLNSWVDSLLLFDWSVVHAQERGLAAGHYIPTPFHLRNANLKMRTNAEQPIHTNYTMRTRMPQSIRIEN